MSVIDRGSLLLWVWFLLLPLPAVASFVTYTFSGVVYNAGNVLGSEINVGDTFSGSYTFDSATPNDSVISGLGYYVDAVPSFAATVGAYPFSAGRMDIEVDDNFSGRDMYSLHTGEATGSSILGFVPWYFHLYLIDYSQLAFTSVALPPESPDLTLFGEQSLELQFIGAGTRATVYASITHLSISSVPEPLPLTLVFLGGALLLLDFRRRSKHKAGLAPGEVATFQFYGRC